MNGMLILVYLRVLLPLLNPSSCASTSGLAGWAQPPLNLLPAQSRG